MKKEYTAPLIERNVAGYINKFANQSVVNYQDQLENVPVERLVSQYGSPLFVFVESSIRKRYRRLCEAVKLHYPNTEIAWSYKTNYLGAICSILHQEGARAEVVSGMEYEMARRLGIKGNTILFNGPGKRKDELARAIEEGARIHIDNLDELFLIEKLAGEQKKTPEVAIRLNMDTGIQPQWSRFGFNYENGEAYRAVQRLVTGKQVKLVGLHGHIGTFILDAWAYYYAAAKLLYFAQKIKEDFKIVIGYLDLGGGFASTNTLHSYYLPGEFASPSFDQFAAAIGQAFNEAPFARDESPRLILETGRAVIDESGYLISTVLGKKHLPTGERGVILDAGANILFTAWWYKLNITPTQPLTGTYQNTVFYGPLCMNIDVIRPLVSFPDVKVGDRVLISPVGAYNVTQWMQFIDYRPNVVLITETGELELIREKESLGDITGRERIPEHLKVL
jgi:diaminopimelate decarboxylase